MPRRDRCSADPCKRLQIHLDSSSDGRIPSNKDGVTMAREDDLIFGARSGIQKAVRRSDLDLACTCFDLLWAVKQQRQWLKWRLASIVNEDAYPMVGELAQFFAKLKEFGGKDMDPELDEKFWRKMVYEVVLAPSQKDGAALFFMSLEVAEREIPRAGLHPELQTMLEFTDQIGREGDPADVAEAYLESLLETNEAEPFLSSYEIPALRMLAKRTRMGGMLGDRQCALAVMVLINHRGLKQKEVVAGVKLGVQGWSDRTGRRKPRVVGMPWYAYDMHTAAGKMVMYTYLKHYASAHEIGYNRLNKMWFQLESNYSPPEAIEYAPLLQKPGIWQCVWHQPYLDLRMPEEGLTRQEVETKWVEKVRTKLVDLVVWALEKRANREEKKK